MYIYIHAYACVYTSVCFMSQSPLTTIDEAIITSTMISFIPVFIEPCMLCTVMVLNSSLVQRFIYPIMMYIVPFPVSLSLT